MGSNKIYIKIMLLFFLIFNTSMAFADTPDQVKTAIKDLGKNKTVQIDIDRLEETLKKLELEPVGNARIRGIFETYQQTDTGLETQVFKMGKIFQSNFTCEGIKATIEDVIPVLVEVAETIIEHIPQYAIKRLTGIDVSTPSSTYEMIIDLMLYIFCLIKKAPAVVGTAMIPKTISELWDSCSETNESGSETGTTAHQGTSGQASTQKEENSGGLNKNCSSQTKDVLFSQAIKLLWEQTSNCVDQMRIWVNDVIKGKIKNFKPFKVRNQKNFCEMATNMKKQKSGTTVNVYSPLKFHANEQLEKDDDEVICVEDQFLKSCKNTNPDNREAKTQLNIDSIKKLINDGEKLPNISNRMVNNYTSRNIFNLGYNIVDTLTRCINDPSLLICKDLECSHEPHSECNKDPKTGIIPRLNNIPFKFTYDDNNAVQGVTDAKDFFDYDNLLTKLKFKKLHCLKFNIMNTDERIRFVSSFGKVVHSDVEVNSGIANDIFENAIVKEYCGTQMNVQIKEYELFLKRKIFKIKRTNATDEMKAQRDFSKLQRLKIVFNKASSQFNNVIDACTWRADGKDPQKKFSVLKKDLSGNHSIEEIDISSIHTDNYTRTEPIFKVIGKCSDASCSQMNCVYDDTEVDESYKKLKESKNDANTSEVLPEGEKKILTKTEFVEDVEKNRIKTLESIYNSHNEYETEFSKKVITNQIIRYFIESGYFIY